MTKRTHAEPPVLDDEWDAYAGSDAYVATVADAGTYAMPWGDRLRAGLSAAGTHGLRWLLCLTLAGFAVLVGQHFGLGDRNGKIGGGVLLAGSYAVFVWHGRVGITPGASGQHRTPQLTRKERKELRRWEKRQGGRRG